MARNSWREVVLADGSRGSYTIYDGTLTVTTPAASKTAHLGALPPNVLAKIMLREIGEDTMPPWGL